MALVLAVDDRRNLLETVANVLEAEHSCILASDGDEAVDAYMRNNPALVLLDLFMPGMPGEEVASRILGYDPGARIVAFSVVEQVKRVVELFRLGFRDLLVKPCAAEHLLGVVNENVREPGTETHVRTRTTERVRSALNRALKAGRIPVLVGPKGVGKKTEMREALRDLGVVAAPVIPLCRRVTEAGGLFESARPGSRLPAGLVLWGEEGKPTRAGDEGSANFMDIAREAPVAAGAFHLGIVWDTRPDDAGVDVPSPRFEIVRFPPLSERPPGELRTILERFRSPESEAEENSGEWDVEWLGRFLRACPRAGTMRLMRALALRDEIWSHLRG